MIKVWKKVKYTDMETAAYRKQFSIYADGGENLGKMGRIRLEKKQRQNLVDDQYFRSSRGDRLNKIKII